MSVQAEESFFLTSEQPLSSEDHRLPAVLTKRQSEVVPITALFTLVMLCPGDHLGGTRVREKSCPVQSAVR